MMSLKVCTLSESQSSNPRHSTRTDTVQAQVVSATTKEEAGSEYTLYGVEVTPADGGEPWTVQRRFKDFMGLRAALTALMGSGNLPGCWNDVSKARSVTGRHRSVDSHC